MIVDGLWDDQHCQETMPALCVVDLPLCSNGLLDDDEAGETAVDCGGVCDPCIVNVAYSSSAGASGSVFHAPTVHVTATFDSAVSGVAVADFGLAVTAGVGVTTGLTALDGVPSTRWILSISLVSNLQPANVTVSQMPAQSGSITPPNNATDGGFQLTYQPPQPTYSAGGLSSGDSTASNALAFTATFSSPVSGVAVSDFGLDASGMAVSPPSIVALGGSPSTQWVLTTVIADRPTTGTPVTVASMVEKSGSIDPANAAGTAPFTLVYTPPVPTLSSGAGPSGSYVAGPDHTFTATFTSPVSGVTTSDFLFSSVGVGTTKSVAAQGASPSTVWVLSVSVSAPLKDATLVVRLPASVASPPNAAAVNNPFQLHYVAPPCEEDPCGIAAGRASGCTNVDDLAGEYTCNCNAGLFGATCEDVCPAGYVFASSLTPPRCMLVTKNTTWVDADGNCTASGGTFASIHNKAENDDYWALCQAAMSGRCWAAASDQATEGVWQWVDNSPFDYELWLGSNPDDVSG